MKRNRKAGLTLLGASATVLAVSSQYWSPRLGIDQSQGLIGMAVVFVALTAVVLWRSQDASPPQH